MMARCRPGHAGADYTTQASIVVIASGACGALSGVVAGRLGYAAHFTLSFALCLLAVALLWVLRPAQGEPTVASTTPSV